MTNNQKLYNKIETKNKQIVKNIVASNNKNKPTEINKKNAVQTIKALLEREGLDNKHQQLQKIVMILQENNMFNKKSFQYVHKHTKLNNRLTTLLREGIFDYSNFLYSIFNYAISQYKNYIMSVYESYEYEINNEKWKTPSISWKGPTFYRVKHHTIFQPYIIPHNSDDHILKPGTKVIYSPRFDTYKKTTISRIAKNGGTIDSFLTSWFAKQVKEILKTGTPQKFGVLNLQFYNDLLSYSKEYNMNYFYHYTHKRHRKTENLVLSNFKFTNTELTNMIPQIMSIFKTIILQETNQINNHFTNFPIEIKHTPTTMHPDHMMETTMYPDHMMGTYPTHHSMNTTMHPDHMMGTYPTHHSMNTTIHPDHMMERTMHPDHMMEITISPDHIYDHELNNDLLTIQQKMRRKIKSEIFNELEEDIEEDIERQEKILQSLENYNCPCQEPQLEMLKQTCHPLTSHKTTSFEMAKNIRTPYDKHWLKIYNGHSLKENYSLNNFQSIP